MKSIYNIYNESILDDIETNLANGDKYMKSLKDEVEKFIKSAYRIEGKYKISNNPNKDGMYIVNATGKVFFRSHQHEHLTNGMFIWNKVDGNFICGERGLKSLEGGPKEVTGKFVCSWDNELTSLIGAPKKVGGDFECHNCMRLESLEGAPVEVGGTFNCNNCKNLISLKHGPKKVKDNYYCSGCDSLTSLEGAAKEVGRDFYCQLCKNLESLKGAPKKVTTFICYHCKGRFTVKDVQKYIDLPAGDIEI